MGVDLLQVDPLFYRINKMKLYLYQINETENTINKELLNPYEMDILLKAETDLTQPFLILESVNDVAYTDFNYCHIPELERYYFINRINNMNGKLWRLECECDVLMTYKNDILNSKARLQRNIKNGDFINSSIDSSIIKTVNLFKSDVTIGDDKTIILTTVGA